MSTQRDKLAAEIADVYLSNMGAGPLAGKVTQFDLAEAIITAGYRKPRTITTVEELDALGFGAAILHANNGVLVNDGDPDGENWVSLAEDIHGGPISLAASDVALPATVLYEPAAGGAS